MGNYIGDAQYIPRMKLLLLALCVALAACVPLSSTDGASPAPNVTVECANNLTYSTTGECVPSAPANPFCGGIAGRPCPQGFTCVLDGNYPDAGGTCIKENTDVNARDYCDTADDCILEPSCCDCGVGVWVNKQYPSAIKCQQQCMCEIGPGRHPECIEHHCIGKQGLPA